MINIFLNNFKKTAQENIEEDNTFFKNLPPELFSIINEFDGSAFNGGLYSIHSFKSCVKWSLLIGDYFDTYRNKVYPFGFDWMGRQFGINHSGDAIYMFDPSTLEDFVLTKDIESFHNEDLSNGMLAEDLFLEALAFCGVQEIKSNQCIGHLKPLFLGGENKASNFQVQDQEVYWSMQHQLFTKIKDLPEGTKIGKITFD